MPLVERAVLEARLEALPELQARVDASLACGRPLGPDLLARLWLAEGASLELRADPAGAEQAFAAAWRADPDLWNADFGPQLRAAYDRAVDRAPVASGQLRVEAEGAWVVRVDGRPTAFESTQPSGLHLVQVHAPEQDVRYGLQVVLLPGQRVTVRTGLVAETAPPPVIAVAPEPLAPIVAPRARSNAGLWVAVASGALSVASGALWLSENSAMRSATTLDALDAARGRQIGFSAAGFGFGALGVGALVAHASR